MEGDIPRCYHPDNAYEKPMSGITYFKERPEVWVFKDCPRLDKRKASERVSKGE
jgi:hypothetical protein